MSLQPSSLSRSTPTTVPASQNTAPVIKFRCLYTHDVRRKAKRWQDGYLKFHTFNKRAMVYDDAGNFIGDHHWRESHEIQDGDELELDKGVLIQVSDCMETTQTDISVLFDKRKASQESPQPQKTPAPQRLPPPSSNVSMSSSYARQPPLARPARPFNPLKPLNDVLGIQKGPIGRSVTPQSPYDQCHRLPRPVERTRQEDQWPVKRPKPTPTSDMSQHRSTDESVRSRPGAIELDNSTFAKPPPKAVPVSSVRKTLGKSTDSPRVQANSIRKSVEQTKSRERPRPEDSRPNNNTTVSSGTTRPSISEASRWGQSRPESTKVTNNHNTTLDRTCELPLEQTSRKEQSRSEPSNPSAQPTPARIASNVQTSSTRPQVLSEKSKSVINSNNAPINPLRMSNEKPRQKLMYRALLPSKGTREVQAKSNPTVVENSLVDLDLDFPLSVSTLAVLEESNPATSNTVDGVISNINNSEIASVQIQTPKVYRSQNSQTKLLNRIPTHASVYGPLASPAGAELQNGIGDDLALLLASSPLGPDHSNNEALGAGPRAPVMRSNSDISHMFPESAPVRSAPAENLASVAEAHPTTAIKWSERVFRKSHSDTNALRNLENASNGLSRPLATTGPPRNQRNVGTVKTESGPWTADALDFFDWWPPGRPMPA